MKEEPQIHTDDTDKENECDHKFVHLETWKQAAERASIGYSAAKPWKRKDVFFCERCLLYKTVIQEASLYDFPYGRPEWW